MPAADRPVWLKTITEPRKTLFYGRFYAHSKLAASRGEYCCYPMVPERPHLGWKLARLCGLRLTNRPSSATRIAQAFCSHTQFELPPQPDLPAGVRVLNERCLDVSKVRVEAAHSEAFGYGMAVDPRTHEGAMVEKGDENAAHDGRVLQGPIQDPKPGSVYQVEIDNRADAIDGRPVREPMVVDMRVMVVGDELPVGFRKYRLESERFLNTNEHASWHEVGELLDDAEQSQVLAFAGAMGLDLGEIDVLRDRTSGRIYAIDVNPTPHSPPGVLEGPIVAYSLMKRAAAAFERQWL
ncbi:MAG: hypothetical protein AAFX79_10455 [Planctomycetota bacterium]